MRYVIDNAPGETDFELPNTGALRTAQNCRNLLMTRMGEVPFDRRRGFDTSLYHLPIEKMRDALLPELDRVMLWEPDAEVVSARCEALGSGEIRIECVIEVAG